MSTFGSAQGFWQPLILSLELAFCATAVLLAVGLPLAWWLACGKSRLRAPVHAIATLPLVLPPTVLGYYLLAALGPATALGRGIEAVFGARLVFSFPGLVVGSVIYSLPFMVNPLESALAALPGSLTEAAYTLGKSRWETFRSVQLPNARPALISAVALSFAHILGEFGVVLMIGGAIPGRTKVASIAIFNAAESLDDVSARAYALILLACALPVLLVLETYRRRAPRGGSPW